MSLYTAQTRHTTKIRNGSIQESRVVSCGAIAICIAYATCLVAMFSSCHVVSSAVCKGLYKSCIMSCLTMSYHYYTQTKNITSGY